jgi:hypothetical protein
MKNCNGRTSTVGFPAVDFSVYLVVTCLEGKVSRGKRVVNLKGRD